MRWEGIYFLLASYAFSSQVYYEIIYKDTVNINIKYNCYEIKKGLC